LEYVKNCVVQSITMRLLTIGWLLVCSARLSVCLKLLELNVPSHKLVGEEAVLECKFDMEADSLYSVKWYRNEQEFYRFVPNDRPKLQIFPQDGIRVERSKSSKHTVVLFDLQLEASGTYRCEVSAEAPSFRTKHREAVMMVVQEPHSNQIQGLQASYEVGEEVNVTCYSRGSSPPADLLWTVNGEKIYDQSDRRLSRQSGSNFQGQWRGGSQAVDDRGGLRSEQPGVMYGTIKVWYEKQEKSLLDTAASNLRLPVTQHLLERGINLQCTASIGEVYWHLTTETAAVSSRLHYPSWMSSGSQSSENWNVVTFILAIRSFNFH